MEVLDPHHPISLDWKLYQLNVEAIEWMKEYGTATAIPEKLKKFQTRYQKEIDRFYEKYTKAMKPTHPKENMEARFIENHSLRARQALEESVPTLDALRNRCVSMLYLPTEDDQRYLSRIHQLLSALS